MNILAVESSAKAASAAYCRDGALVGQYFQNSGLTHSRTLLPMIRDLLKNLEITLEDVDVFAVSTGPGSFTGLRIGTATVKGLAWGTDKPVCGVSTLEAMAWQAAHLEGILCPVMDARRNEVYNARFSARAGRPERLCEDRAISLEELLEEAKSDPIPYFLLGDGAELCYNWFRDNQVNAVLLPPHIRQQSAWGVARAAQSTPGVQAHALVPHYIRLSQAERERLERSGVNGVCACSGASPSSAQADDSAG